MGMGMGGAMVAMVAPQQPQQMYPGANPQMYAGNQQMQYVPGQINQVREL